MSDARLSPSNELLSGEDLAKIIQRDAMAGALWFTGPASFTALAARDRRVLVVALCALRQPPVDGFQKAIYESALVGLQNLLILAVSHIDPAQLQASKDWAVLSPFYRATATKCEGQK